MCDQTLALHISIHWVYIILSAGVNPIHGLRAYEIPLWGKAFIVNDTRENLTESSTRSFSGLFMNTKIVGSILRGQFYPVDVYFLHAIVLRLFQILGQ
jgi:hypothetical protein